MEERQELNDAPEESISTKEDSKGGKTDNRFTVTTATHDSVPMTSVNHKLTSSVPVMTHPVPLNVSIINHSDQESDGNPVFSKSAGMTDVPSSTNPKISPLPDLTPAHSTSSFWDTSPSTATNNQEVKQLSTSHCGSLYGTTMWDTPSSYSSTSFPEPSLRGSFGSPDQTAYPGYEIKNAFGIVQGVGQNVAPETSLNWLSSILHIRNVSSENVRDEGNLANLISTGLSMPIYNEADTEDSSSHVSGLTLDATGAIGGEEIAFQSVSTNRATGFNAIVGKSIPMSRHFEPSPTDPLLTFIQKQSACLKVYPEEFHQFLLSQDISTMKDLREAMEDDDFVTQDMHDGGLKMFKRKLFLREIESSL
jgi:hypothetical protein